MRLRPCRLHGLSAQRTSSGKRPTVTYRALAFKIHRIGGNISAFSLLRFGTGKERFFGR